MSTAFVRGLPGLVFLACLVALPFASLAQTQATDPIGDNTDAPPAPQQPDEIVREGITRLKQFVAAYQEPSPQQVANFLDTEIAPSFDFAYMARWAAGPYHRRLDEAQRQRFADILSHTFLTALGRNLGSYARPLPEINVSEPQPGRTKNETVVAANIAAYTNLEIKLLFRFYWSPDGWKIFDVSANGASAVGYYRRYYVDLLRRHGPDYVLQ